ncbi:hypothetical protein CERSUDRAFT_61076, partial [Gelatoporia subvermispora B]
LIMAQTTLNIYVSDQIFNYALRLLGTFVGALVGMVCWYIGSGHGDGSPYGMGASVAVFLLPLIFCRIFSPPQYLQGVVMSGATFTLVVGYSWLDEHIAVIGNVGKGWSVAWRRWVLVMIGCLASFVIMMLPPTSGRKAVRLRNASTISSLSYIYSHLMASWISDLRAGSDEKDHIQGHDWRVKFRGLICEAGEQLQALRAQTAIARWEGNIRGVWPKEDYERLVNVQAEMVGSLALVSVCSVGSHDKD